MALFGNKQKFMMAGAAAIIGGLMAAIPLAADAFPRDARSPQVYNPPISKAALAIDANKRFHLADQDRNGVLSEAEFVAHHVTRAGLANFSGRVSVSGPASRLVPVPEHARGPRSDFDRRAIERRAKRVFRETALTGEMSKVAWRRVEGFTVVRADQNNDGWLNPVEMRTYAGLVVSGPTARLTLADRV